MQNTCLGGHVVTTYCRLCGAVLVNTFVDLGMSPLCESYLPAERLDDPETFYPLHVRLCAECLLVQLPAYVPGKDIFTDYAYFSYYSDSHYSYLSLHTACRALAAAGPRVVDVDELGTHGGSLRVHARPADAAGEPDERVKALLAAQEAAGLHAVAGHKGFARAVLKIKSDLLGFLLAAKAEGKTVAGYGAPGKGNTLLNHCGIRSDLFAYTVDRSPHKQGMFLPGTHIRARAHRGNQTGLRTRPAMEPQGRDQQPAGVCPVLGWPPGFPHPRA